MNKKMLILTIAAGLVILAVLSVMLGLFACNEAPPPETTSPTEPPYKTVYVHASITREVGSTVSRTEYVFDEQDQVQEVIVYTNDVETKRHSVECDENGNYVRWTSEGSIMEYNYDAQGNSLGMEMYINDNLVSSTCYTWENGFCTTVTNSMPAQNMTQKVMSTYNADGQLLRQDTYTADVLSSYCIYSRDENGNTLSMTTYLPDGTLYSVSTHSREDATHTVTTADADGAVIQIAVMTYDDAGNLLTHEIYNADNELISKETHTWKAVQVDPDCPRASV